MDQAHNLRKLVQLQKDIDENKVNATLLQKTSQEKHNTKIIAITSGKGGVGKTSITMNLALSLSRESKKKVLVLDADFGTANIDIVIGIFPKFNISHVILEGKPIEDVLIDAPLDVKILSGVSGVIKLNTISNEQRTFFFEQLEKYQSKHQPDFILIDTGAGVGDNVIGFLQSADEVLLVVTPEPTSLSDAYSIIKTMHNQVQDIKFNVLVNMAQSKDQAKRIFNTLNTVSDRFLQKKLNFIGHLSYTHSMTSSIRQQKPLILSYPNSETSLEILNLSNYIANKEFFQHKGLKNFFKIASKYFGWNND